MKRKATRARNRKTRARGKTSRWIRGISDADLKKALAERAKAHAEAAPRSTSRGAAARGGPAFVFLRPECKDTEDCGPDPDDDPPPTDPCAGVPFVSQPDLAAQLNTLEGCPSAADLARIQQAVGRNLLRFKLPDPEVRVSCTAGKIFIRVWGTRVQPGSCADRARDRAQIPDLVAGGNFGLFINSTLIRRLANDAFAVAPKQLSGNGAPSPFGPIHLTGLSVVFKAPNVIQTRITGYDDRPWPDVHFTHVVDDELRALRECHTESHNEFGVLDQIVSTLLLGIFSLALPILLPAFAFALFTNIDAAIGGTGGAGASEGAVGCRINGTLPDEIALPATGGILPPIAMVNARRAPSARRVPRITGPQIEPIKQKLVISYGGPTIDQRGLFVGALATPQDRVPAVHIAGPASLAMFFNKTSTFGEYSAVPDDFFGTLTFVWTVSPGVTVVNQGASRTRINFARGSAQQGDSFQRTISVRVTDQEGSTATASRTITITVNESEGLPPICQTRPWLPQCNPGGPDV